MLLRQSLRRERRSAFTLMEMLIVVAIIVALASIGGLYLLGALGGAQEDLARTQAGTLTQACQQYYVKNKTWPPSLQALATKDPLGGGPYLESLDAIKDPWGKEYQYNPAGQNNNGMKPDISTVSPTNKTIGNWPAAAQH